MLSIKAVRGLPRLRAPGIVPVEEHLMQYNFFPNFVPHTGHTFFHHIQNNISLFQDCLTVKIIWDISMVCVSVCSLIKNARLD